MKTTVSIGAQAHAAVLRCIEEGLVVGVALDGHTLTVDYTGLDQDEALKQAAENLQRVTDAAGEDPELNYATGWFAVMMTSLAHEHVEQNRRAQNRAILLTADELAQPDDVLEATLERKAGELSTLPGPVETVETEAYELQEAEA